MASFLAQGTWDQLLDQAIVADALQAFADHQGLLISQTMIDREIANIPAFHNLTGQFDQNVYREQLRALNMTEAKLHDDIVQSLIQRQLLGPIALGGRVPDGRGAGICQSADGAAPGDDRGRPQPAGRGRDQPDRRRGRRPSTAPTAPPSPSPSGG